MLRSAFKRMAITICYKKLVFDQKTCKKQIFWSKVPQFFNFNQSFIFFVMPMSIIPSVSYFSSSEVVIPELVT